MKTGRNGKGSVGNPDFEDVSSYSAPLKRGKKKRKRLFLCLKLCLALVCVCLIGAGSAMAYVSTSLIGGLTTQPLSKDLEKLGIPEDVELDDSVTNIALFGLDTRGDSFEGNSDIMMIVSVDNRHKMVKLISILRDTKVELEGSPARINAAYAYGGPDLAVYTLNRTFALEDYSLNIQDYVSVNFGNAAKVIEAVDGVDLEITAEEAGQINANLNLALQDDTRAEIVPEDFIEEKAGMAHLNGNQTVAYSRIRVLGGDAARAGRQQKVLEAVLQKVRGGRGNYAELIRAVMPLCKTSLDLEDILALSPILLTDFTVETLTVPGDREEAWGGLDPDFDDNWVFIYDFEQAARHIREFLEAGPSQPSAQSSGVS